MKATGSKQKVPNGILGFTETDLQDLITYYEHFDGPPGGPDPVPSDPEFAEILMMSDQLAVPVASPIHPCSNSPSSSRSGSASVDSSAGLVGGSVPYGESLLANMPSPAGASSHFLDDLSLGLQLPSSPSTAAAMISLDPLSLFPSSSLQSSLPNALPTASMSRFPHQPFYLGQDSSQTQLNTDSNAAIVTLEEITSRPHRGGVSQGMRGQGSVGVEGLGYDSAGSPLSSSLVATTAAGLGGKERKRGEQVASGGAVAGAGTGAWPVAMGAGAGLGDDRNQQKKGLHSEVERKRRDLINERIYQLKALVPDLINANANKATILGRAVDHMSELVDENKSLQSQKEVLEAELRKLKLNSGSGSGDTPDDESPAPSPRVGPSAAAGVMRNGRNRKNVNVVPVIKHELNAFGTSWSMGPSNPKRGIVSVPTELGIPPMSLKQFIASALKLAMENMIVTDPNRLGHPIVYATQGFQQMTGYTKEEIIGRNCRFLQGQETDNDTVKGIGQAIKEGREYLTEVLNYRKDGTPFWNLVYITPIQDTAGRTCNYVGVQFDITASNVSSLEPTSNFSPSGTGVEIIEPRTPEQQVLKRSGMALAANPEEGSTKALPNQGLKQLLASILHLSMSNLIVTDPKLPDNPIVYASDGFRNLTGFSRSDIIGRNCRFLQGPGTDAQTIKMISKGLREKKPFLAEILNYRKDKSPFWNLLFITPVLDPYGEPFKYIGVQLDVTDHH
eukprot:CAMPEP_0184658036 /NCGR_PEP_ID=MMETSP0308-20130426/23338_1 /TAXON_ID=38269 /ORGANISM="Gloeochaete witrockiana, Strain SAG 46.84" /LENGTH=730 /DNA_ID=CAMNT_0027096613 /DNA_START=51 /DNA_END=2243 /DNA_ORIENTATION=+